MVDAHEGSEYPRREYGSVHRYLFTLHPAAKLNSMPVFNSALHPAASCRFGTLLDGPDIRRTGTHCAADIAFTDVMAGADLHALSGNAATPSAFGVRWRARVKSAFLALLGTDTGKHHLLSVAYSLAHRPPAHRLTGFLLSWLTTRFFVDLLWAVRPLVA